MRGKKKVERSPLPWRLNNNGEDTAQYSNRTYLIEKVSAWDGEYMMKASISLTSNIKLNIRCYRSSSTIEEAKEIAERLEHLFADHIKQRYRRRDNGIQRPE